MPPHLTLLAQLVRLDLRTRYTHSWLGWSVLVLQPLGMLVIYSVVFGEILQLKTGPQSAFFSEYLLAGLIAFNALAEVATRAPSLIAERRELLLNTPLPAALIPWIPVGSSLAVELLTVGLLGIWLLMHGVAGLASVFYYLPWLALRLIWSSTLSYGLSVLGVVIIDLRQLITPMFAVLLLLAPVFYRLEQIPPAWQTLIHVNPLTVLVRGYQAALIEQHFNAMLWLGVMSVSLVVWWGSWVMAKQLMPRLRYVL